MNIVITGISGFVGKNLALKLVATGHKVMGISRSKSYPATITWDELDAANIHAKAWIHLAGKAHDLKNKSLASDYNLINVGLTEKVFEAFMADETATHFIFMSSVKAVASSVKGILKETDAFEVDNPYGASKREAESYLQSKTLPAGKRLIILRPCMIHGPGNKGNLNLLYSFLKNGMPYPLGAFENRRSYLSVGNLTEVILNICEMDDFPAGTYNVADDEDLSTNDLVKLIGESIGKKGKIWNISPSIIQFMAKAGDMLKLPLNSARLQKLTESYLVSNDKIKLALGWERMPIAARDGLKETIQSFNSK
ncbi:MAG: NAD-dependent epimerase/dehydratase family protein [Bacteroidetes bacterium]|nr:NAD-dependent epimerase/dehydratase family protein [Bacteroidota bacterium]